MNGADRALAYSAARAAAVVLLTVLAGCSHLPRPHLAWPWRHKPTPLPQQVHELTITTEGGTAASFPQYWKRNTLLVDLQGASGMGSVVLKPVEGTTWPVRLAFRVLPGQFGVLEIRANARLLLPIATQGVKPIDLEVAPGVYNARTAQITVTWEPPETPAQ